MSPDTVALVPPGRLGALLRQARLERGASLDELALDGPLSAELLAEVEAGRRRLSEAELAAVLERYGVDPGTLVPDRAVLVVDLEHGRLAVGATAETIDRAVPGPDEVLAAYLSLVYTLRHATPGEPVTLREADLDVLARTLDLARPVVADRLDDLMRDPDGAVGEGVRQLRRRLLVPVAGIVVAATAVGTLLLVAADDEEPAVPPAAVTAVEVPVDIGDAVVQQRLPDGTPGPVVPIGPDGSVPAPTATTAPPAPSSGPAPDPTTSVPAAGIVPAPPAPAAAEPPAQVGPAQTIEGPGGLVVIHHEGPLDLQPGQVQLAEAQQITPEGPVELGPAGTAQP